MRLFHYILGITFITILAACGGETDHGHNHDDHGHSHGDHGHSHDDHGHKHDEHSHDHEGHGEEHKLGSISLGADTFTISQFGSVEANGEGVFSIQSSNKNIKEMRVWVGNEDGRGSVKALLKAEDNVFHGHIEVPKKLAETAALWLEISDTNNKTVNGHIGFKSINKKHDHNHHEHDH